MLTWRCGPFRSVITGFNTDIEHDGVVYHVQTEDKGLDTPIILSLVYVGGAILASKRAPYEDLIAEGFSDEVLAERLKRQHKLICAAINNGRIDDLKKMTQRAADSTPAPEVSAPAEVVAATEEAVPKEEVAQTEEPKEFEVVEDLAQGETVEPVLTEPEEFEVEEPPFAAASEAEPTAANPSLDEFEFESYGSQQWVPPPKVEPPPPPPEPEVPTIPVVVADPHHDAYTVHDPRGHLHQTDSDVEDGLQILLLDDAQFYSGESRTLRVLVVNRQGDNEKPLSGTLVSVKILGTAFRPLIYSLKTDRDGVATIATQIPQFTSGRAAVLVRAATKEQAAELRRVIHPAK